MKKLTVMLLMLLPVVSLAHVKWFAEEGYYVKPYSIGDGPVLIAIIASLALIVLGVYLERKIQVPNFIQTHLGKWGPGALSLASIGFGGALLIFSLSGFVFAPNLPATNNLLLILQGIAGVMIMLGIFERAGAMLLLFVFALALKEYGVVEMMDTLEVVGFAIYALIVGRPKWKIVSLASIEKFLYQLKLYGVPILRVGTGLNLMILGFSEKLLTPSLTGNFLNTYHWNFMQSIGMSDYWFAFSAGVVEFLFGLFLVLGLVTRTTTLCLAGFLITTLILLGPVELVGHLPHFSIAIVLLILGAGERLRLRV